MGARKALRWRGGALASAAPSARAPRPCGCLLPAGRAAAGLSFGADAGGNNQAWGVLDEVETYNYPIGPVELNAEASLYTLAAAPSLNPPQITLQWRQGYSSATILKTIPGSTTWTNIANTIAGLSFTDTNVVPGQRYQYTVGGEPILSAINGTPVEYRGKVILLVDQQLAPSLGNSLAQLTADLIGDGWIPIQHQVARHDDINWSNNTNNIILIHNQIVQDYNLDPTNTKAVFIIGHVAVPYSGSKATDGHRDYLAANGTNACVVFTPPPGTGSTCPPTNQNHIGAWPADVYYGDMDGLWTDATINVTNNDRTVNQNFPSDGKFDQDNVPDNGSGSHRIELAVGRIDFANLPSFTNAPPYPSEAGLLQRYLAKEHSYRMKQTVLGPMAMVASYFGGAEPGLDTLMIQNALRNGSRLLGIEPGSIQDGDLFLQALTSSFLLGVQGGFGWDTDIIPPGVMISDLGSAGSSQ